MPLTNDELDRQTQVFLDLVDRVLAGRGATVPAVLNAHLASAPDERWYITLSGVASVVAMAGIQKLDSWVFEPEDSLSLVRRAWQKAVRARLAEDSDAAHDAVAELRENGGRVAVWEMLLFAVDFCADLERRRQALTR